MRTTTKLLPTILIIVLTCIWLAGCSGPVRLSMAHNEGIFNRNTGIDMSIPWVRLADTVKPPSSHEQITPGPIVQGPIPYEGTPGWARTWGGIADSLDLGKDVAVDNLGNVYVTGAFYKKVTFNTNSGRVKKTPVESIGDADIFLSKFDANGVFQWARTWGGPVGDFSKGVAVDSVGNVYVTGYFAAGVDFNPDKSQVDMRTTNGSSDVFLCQFDRDGVYHWVRTWGGISTDEAYGVASRSLNQVCVVGVFSNDVNNGPVDFDPGPGFDKHSSKGKEDVFLTMFDHNGEHLGVRTWGGTDTEYAYGVALDKDSNAYVVGSFFSPNLDFSGGQTLRGALKSPNGGCDVYLSKFNKGGDFLWVQTWGEDGYDTGAGVATDKDTGDVYVTGSFWRTVDFSAGQLSDGYMLTAKGENDAFLSKFNPAGIFQWALAFGGIGYDGGSDVAVTRDGYVYACGDFVGTADFGPSGMDPHPLTSNGDADAFLLKLTTSGVFTWVRAIGGPVRDSGLGVAVDPVNGAYMTGWFGDEVNFATKGVDNHTAKGKSDAYICSFPPDGDWGAFLKIKDIGLLKAVERKQ